MLTNIILFILVLVILFGYIIDLHDTFIVRRRKRGDVVIGNLFYSYYESDPFTVYIDCVRIIDIKKDYVQYMESDGNISCKHIENFIDMFEKIPMNEIPHNISNDFIDIYKIKLESLMKC